MELILGKRDYENTATGKYPKYNLDQLNRYADMEYYQFAGISLVFNLKSFDLFGKYQNELDENQTNELNKKIEQEYGMHNVDLDHMIDYDKYQYNKETKEWTDLLYSPDSNLK